MPRLTTLYFSILTLILVVCSPLKIEKPDYFRTQELTKSFTASESVVANQQAKLTDITPRPDFIGQCCLQVASAFLLKKDRNTFSHFHIHRSLYGSHHPAGPSPPRLA